MTDKFTTNLNFFLNEQQEACLDEFRTENKEYDRLRRSHAEDNEKFTEILAGLPEKDIAFTDQYLENVYRIESLEFDRVYIQGYRDCVRLLSVLGVFEHKGAAEE